MATFGRREQGRRGGRPRRPGVERLEGRTLLNASIDVAADGSIVYKTDPVAAQSLLLTTSGGVYTFAVDPGDAPIDVTSNAAGLVVTGSGTTTVTVASPAVGMRIEAGSAGQTIRVRSTALPTVVVLQADSERVILGDDQAAGSGGLRALAGAITVSSTSSTFTSNSLTVDDGPAAYASGVTPTYTLTATSIASASATGFGGINYTGLTTLTLKGTSDASADSPLYLITGTAGGVATTIDATAGPASRSFSIVGTSSSATSKLTLLSAGSANLYASSVDSPVFFNAGAGRSTVSIEAVRGATYGLDSDLVLQGGGGTIDVQVSNFWNTGTRRGNPNWALGFDPGSTSPFAALRDATNPNVGGLYFRPAEVHGLGLNASGNVGASLLVDFRNGDPLPWGAAAGGVDDPRAGLTYVGAAGVGGGAGYALAFVGAPPEGAFSTEAHSAFPLYRGLIELTTAGGATRNVAYQLDAAAPLLDDTATVASYRWFYDIMNGSVDGVRTLPNGSTVSAVIDSTLNVAGAASAVIEGQGLLLAEANANAYLANYLVAGKTNVRLLRGWSSGAVTTVVNYAPAAVNDAGGTTTIPPVIGLATLSVEDASPAEAPTADVVRLDAAPPGAAVFILQNGGADSAIVKLTGLNGATSVGLDGGTSSTAGDPDKDTFYIDADGLALGPSSFVGLGAGAFQIPALTTASAPVSARNYEDVQVFNSSTPTFQAQPTALAATAYVPLTNVTAGVVTVTLPGLTLVGFRARIAWGDGSATAGTIQAVPGSPGMYRVIGSHTYTRSGVFTPVVTLSGTSAALTEVSGVPVTYQVSGSSGTTATPPSLGVVLTPGSDSGVSSSDLLTNVVRPTFAGLSGTAGARIDLYAASPGASALIFLGSTTADDSGAWAITSTATLADGDYRVQAVSTSASTPANGTATLAGTLRIDTLGPRVWSVTVAGLAREVRISIRDRGGAGDAGSALYAADLASNYAFATAGVLSVLTAPPSPATSAVVTLRTGRIRNGVYTLTILAGRDLATGLGLFDYAGNPLDGAFNGGFPSGGSNTGQDFLARVTVRGNRATSIRPA